MSVWKDIVGYEGIYQVSDEGRVKSLDRMSEGKCVRPVKGKELKPWKDTRGYPQVYLCKAGVRKPISVHRLVMLTFVGEDINKPTVNHKNGIIDDNRLQNLEWTTQKENNRHAFDTGLMDSMMGEKGSKSGLTNEQAIEIVKMHDSGVKPKEISIKYGVKRYHIVNIVTGKSFRRVTRNIDRFYTNLL